MQLNDLIFKELVRRGYSLEGNTRIWNISDSKLWYLTPQQAKAYLSLEDAKDYSKSMFDTEIDMLHKAIPDIVDRVLHGSAVNIIDIGCGDGKKAIPILEYIHKKTKFRYCPIDISSYMVAQAIAKIRKLNLGEVLQFRWNISDFDNLENVSSLLRDESYRQNFLLFLGSTISNFEFHEVMYEVAEAMNDDLDYLLLGVALGAERGEAIAKSYMNKRVDEFLSLILTQIGFSRSELEMGVRYRNSRIEIYYTVKKARELHFGGQSISFMEGDQILVAVSRRYIEKELRDSLKLYFDTTKFYFNSDKSWALVLCRK
jgi:uncharacterized SAM-dependent methyltransferase